MHILIVGDAFIPADSYLQAFSDQAVGPEVDLRAITWTGGKSEQHALQQRMESGGPGAVGAPAELLAAVPAAQALCLHFAPVNGEVLDAAPQLRVVAVARSGLENVDLPLATERGVAVVPSHGRNAGAVAELQIGLMLAEARNIARADASIKAGGWRKEFPGRRIEIAGRTIGMVGFGKVGQAFAQRLRGFEPILVAFDPYVTDEQLDRHGVIRAATMEEVLTGADFVVVQARLSPQTERFIGAEQLRMMRPDAYFVNVSRSRVVDNDALLAVLREGRIAGAALDVFDTEPLPADSPWRQLDNVTLTSHFGGDTEDTNRISAGMVVEAVLEYARTGRVSGAVNARDLGWA